MLEKVERARADFHAACKAERSASNLERNASADTSMSPEQLKKLTERVTKCKEDVSRSREKYEMALKEISEYNDQYQDDMSKVFQVGPDLSCITRLNHTLVDLAVALKHCGI